MFTENALNEKAALQLDFLTEVKERIGFGEAKTAIMAMYEAAQLADYYGATALERNANFQYFKLLYNLFLKLDMLENPTENGVNTL